MQRSLLPSLLLSAVLAGCSSAPLLGSNDSAADAATAAAALPAGATVRLQDSLVMGSGDAWVGRLVANVGSDAGAAYKYFLDTYPAQGWTLLSSVRAKTSLLVFARQDRTATIEVVEGGVGSGAVATVTVTPRAAAAVQGSTGAQASPVAPAGSSATSATAPASSAPRRLP